MHCPRRMLFTLLCLPLFAFASRAAAQASFSSLIPPDAEFAATLNVRTVRLTVSMTCRHFPWRQAT